MLVPSVYFTKKDRKKMFTANFPIEFGYLQSANKFINPPEVQISTTRKALRIFPGSGYGEAI